MLALEHTIYEQCNLLILKSFLLYFSMISIFILYHQLKYYIKKMSLSSILISVLCLVITFLYVEIETFWTPERSYFIYFDPIITLLMPFHALPCILPEKPISRFFFISNMVQYVLLILIHLFHDIELYKTLIIIYCCAALLFISGVFLSFDKLNRFVFISLITISLYLFLYEFLYQKLPIIDEYTKDYEYMQIDRAMMYYLKQKIVLLFV